MVRNIAIAGISSKLALLAAAELLRKQPEVLLRGSCRDVGKLPDFLRTSSRVTLVQSGPYDVDALRSLVRGSDVVICCYYADNETMVAGQKLLIDLCEEEAVPRYVASDYTADYTNLDWGDIPIKDPMKHIKEYLDANPKVQGVHVLVGLLMETFWAYFNVWDPQEKKIRYWCTGKEEWDLTTYHTAAQYLAAVVLDRQAIGVKRFVGDRIGSFDMAKDIEAIFGFRPALENAGSLQDIYQKLHAESGIQDPVAAGTYYMLTGKICLGRALDNTAFPDVKPETFRGFLQHQTKPIDDN